MLWSVLFLMLWTLFVVQFDAVKMCFGDVDLWSSGDLKLCFPSCQSVPIAGLFYCVKVQSGGACSLYTEV